jgi:hypothetical protein
MGRLKNNHFSKAMISSFDLQMTKRHKYKILPADYVRPQIIPDIRYIRYDVHHLT